jgi:hypothetical protein
VAAHATMPQGNWSRRWRKLTMGAHHFELSLVPRTCFKSTIPKLASEAEFEAQQESDSGWWVNTQPSEVLLSQLRRLLPNNKSWAEVEEFVTGGVCGSDLRIWKTGGRIWEISFRFSPISDGWNLMEQFLRIARGANCILRVRATCEVIEPDESVVREQLNKSRAMRFLKDPAGAIVEAGKSKGSGAGDEFKRVADEVFTTNSELFRKLAE